MEMGKTGLGNLDVFANNVENLLNNLTIVK